MSFFDMFKKSNTKTLAKMMRVNTNNDPVKEALNYFISETELSNILKNQQSSMVKGEKYFLDGINLAQNNKQESAIECFTKSIDCYDGASGPFLNRGVMYHQLGMYEEAVKDYKKAVELETAENTGALDVAKHNLALVYELIDGQQT
jgi:tetratricopeptide (TPR) repeat protein